MKKPHTIKFIRTIITTIIWLYVSFIAIISLPPVEHELANMVESMLSDHLDTEVQIKRIKLGWMNSITIDDMIINDRYGNEMFEIARASATFNFKDAINGKISIESAQLFGIKASLYKESPETTPNYDFVIKALSNDNTEESSPLSLKVAGLIVRHANIKYDVKSEPLVLGKLDPNHIEVKDGAITMNFKYENGKITDIAIKRLNAKEINSGIDIKRITGNFVATEDHASITNTNISWNNSEIIIDTANVNYENWGDRNNKKWSVTCLPIKGNVALKDLCWLDSTLASTKTILNIDALIDGNENKLNIDRLIIQSEKNDLFVDIAGHAGKDKYGYTSFLANIKKIQIEGNAFSEFILLPHLDSTITNHLYRLGSIDLKGAIEKTTENATLKGNIDTECGEINIHIESDPDKIISGEVKTNKFNIGQLLDSEKLGYTSFYIKGSGIEEAKTNSYKSIIGNIEGAINDIEYSGYKYTGIGVNAFSDIDGIGGEVILNDENLKLNLSGRVDTKTNVKNCDLSLVINEFRPHSLNLTSDYIGDNFSLNATANISGSSISNIEGELSLDSMIVSSGDIITSPEYIQIQLESDGIKSKDIHIDGNIISANIKGDIDYKTLVSSIVSKFKAHLPTIFNNKVKTKNIYDFDIEIKDSKIIRHLLNKDYYLDTPIKIKGNVNDEFNEIEVNINNDKISYEEFEYENINITCTSTNELCEAFANITRIDKEGKTYLTFYTDAHDDTLSTKTSWRTEGKFDKKGFPNNSNGTINAQALFSDSTGNTKAIVNLNRSEIVMRDTIWYIHPSSITIFNNMYKFNNVGISHENQHIIANGTVSSRTEDSLLIDIKDIPVEYLQGIANFHAVKFGGKLSGVAQLRNINSSIPQIEANVKINNMLLNNGRMGNANLDISWDEDVKGIAIKGLIEDKEDIWTSVNGFISPAQNDILLDLYTHNTRAEFLNGFIGSIFENIDGGINGKLSIIGPLNDVNLQGDIIADIGMTLKPTKVRYNIKGDTIRLQPYKIGFDNISIFDKDGNKGLVNGNVTHKNFKNFAYEFGIELNKLLCYDEKKFNSDKFYATLYANGDIKIKGEDGHPLRITANVSPSKNSVFAYDAATPDAITNSNFITFRNISHTTDTINDIVTAFDTILNVSNLKDYKYKGDIYMDVNLELNKNCEIKLRMDNTENGYMSTFGAGNIKARYHNKSPFKLDGTYYINEGKYRLYLQDFIYRDLLIQPGSQVEFGGNPFDANIHLICHHTINSVPLSDLTATTAYSSNNKVKVICILDITGTLEQMNFKFNLNLPNVNDETKQLVKSMINSEEEMNTQIIYLLGLGRFYTNEYARMNNDNKSSQAVNSLLSSTLSGQINNMLSNVIGTDSKWNFGTGLTTGENGWEDLDVEGILSGRLLDDRLLINGNFGYRDNSITQTSNFIGDFDVRWRISETGNTYIKAYNQTNDRYFTKATLNTQGIGISYEKAFESWKDLFNIKSKK